MYIRRKVYSINSNNDLYTIIIPEQLFKLFSDYLDQRLFVSRRKSKKMIKKALEADKNYFNEAEKLDKLDLEFDDPKYKEARKVRREAIGKIQGLKDSGKIFDRSPHRRYQSGENPVAPGRINRIKAVANDKYADELGRLLNNNNPNIAVDALKTAESLKRSRGAAGVRISSINVNNKYDAKGEQLRELNKLKEAERRLKKAEAKQARRVAQQERKAAELAKFAEEAKLRLSQSNLTREMQKLENTRRLIESASKRSQSAAAKVQQVTAPAPTTVSAPAPTSNVPAVVNKPVTISQPSSGPIHTTPNPTTYKPTANVPAVVSGSAGLNAGAAAHNAGAELGRLQRMKKWASKNKKALGIVGATALTAGGIQYYNRKKKQADFNNNQ